MNIDEHGGGCCGMMHIYAFENGPRPYLLRLLDTQMRDWVEENYASAAGEKTFNVLLEAVLTDDQMANGWAPELKQRGWKLVTRFFNSNSGNYCNVLHYTPHEPRGRNRTPRPYAW
jgi:hypothetical protein